MKTLSASHQKAKCKLSRLAARLIEDEARLKTATYFAKKYPAYSVGLAEAVSADLKRTWVEFKAIRELLNRKENF